MSPMIRYGITLSLLIIVACATKQLTQKRERLTQQGFSKEHIDGYVDGCSSGYKQAGDPYYEFSQDMVRYQSDQSYSTGWDEGHAACKSDFESLMETFDTFTSD